MWLNIVLLITFTIATYTDLRQQKVSNKLVLLAFIFTLLILISEHKFPEALFKAIPAIFAAIYLFKKGIGGADVKLLILLALAVSPIKIPIILIITYMVGAIRICYEKLVYKKQGPIPLVPGMFMGYLLTFLL